MNENRKKIIIYIVLLLILLAIIFGVVVLIKNKSSQSSTTPDTADKNLFGYFTKNKNQTSSDQLSNGTTVVSNGTTVTSNSSTGFIQNVINTITGNGANQNNSNNTNGTTNSGSDTVNGGGTTTFNVGNGTSTTVSDVTVDTVTGLPTDGITVGNATNTGGGTGLGTSTTTSTTGGGVGVGTGTTGTVEDTLCRDTDTIQYRVKQPQGDVVFAEDGELIIDDRSFPAGTLAISAQGLWNGSQYIKIKECIPAEDTVDVAPFDPIVDDLSGQAPLDACRSIANTNNPTATEMRDCALYRTWNVWTYPDNYIKASNWNDENVDRIQFQKAKTKIRTEFNNIVEKISSERSLANTEYDLKSLITFKQSLSSFYDDCKLLRSKLAILLAPGLTGKPVSHKQIADTLALQYDDFKTLDMKNVIRNVSIDPLSSMLGTPAGSFAEVNFINGTSVPDLALLQPIADKKLPTSLVDTPKNNPYRGADMNYPVDPGLHKDGISYSFYQKKQPQSVLDLFQRDEDLNLFCKLTDASLSYTYPATGTSQGNGQRLYCDQIKNTGDKLDPFIPIGNNTTAISSSFRGSNFNNYNVEPNNWWYRISPYYLIYKLYKDN